MTTTTIHGETENYRYDANNRLTDDDTWEYRYNEVGNLIGKTGKAMGEKSGESWVYNYDLLNRLTSVEKNGGLVASYLYDGEGLRIRKISAETGKTTYFMFGNGGELLYEVDNQDYFYQYVYVGGSLFGRLSGEVGIDARPVEKVYYHTDHLGSVTAITKSTGPGTWKKVWDQEFEAFGSPTDELANEYGYFYTGKQLDLETGLYYYNARWQDPKTGRFITEDPISDGLNWYVYTHNNPLFYTDPTGMYTPQMKDSERGDLQHLEHKTWGSSQDAGNKLDYDWYADQQHYETRRENAGLNPMLQALVENDYNRTKAEYEAKAALRDVLRAIEAANGDVQTLREIARHIHLLEGENASKVVQDISGWLRLSDWDDLYSDDTQVFSGPGGFTLAKDGWSYKFNHDGTIKGVEQAGIQPNNDIFKAVLLLQSISSIIKGIWQARHAVQLIDDAGAQIVDDIGTQVVDDGVAGAAKTNTHTQGTNYLYQKVDANGNHLKYGITKNLRSRYTKAQLNGGRLRVIAVGTRKEMLTLERALHQTLPIGPEEAQAFYINLQANNGFAIPPYKF